MEKLCRSECQIILWGLQPGYLAANELHIFLFTNRREVNSPWWVIQIAAAPVSLHSSLYCFPQAKVSEYLVSFLCCGVYIHESLEGLQLYPGSVAQGAASGVCSPLPAPVGEKIEGLRSCSGARAGAGGGRSAPSWPMTLFTLVTLFRTAMGKVYNWSCILRCVSAATAGGGRMSFQAACGCSEGGWSVTLRYL